MNRYIYALNNPLLFHDASGLSAQEFSGLGQYLSFSEFLLEKSFDEMQKAGKYLLSLKPGDPDYQLFEDLARRGNAIDFKGLGFSLKFAGDSFMVYSTIKGSVDELASRGITVTSFLDAWQNIVPNIEFGLHNGDAGLNAVTQGVTSATAFTIDTLTFGLAQLHGQDLENWFTPNYAY